MKLRLKGDSVRLRLGPAEVHRLVEVGSVAEQTRFGPASLAYVVELSAAADVVGATFDGRTLRVSVPAVAGRRWAASAEAVEIRADQPAGDGRRLTILIEKDFECLHGEDAGDDAFPNPAAAAGT